MFNPCQTNIARKTTDDYEQKNQTQPQKIPANLVRRGDLHDPARRIGPHVCGKRKGERRHRRHGWHRLRRHESCAKAGANIAALCDVDRRRIRGAREHPKARLYADFREMLDKEHKHLDGVVVATPDHTHASISIAAMRRGLHCYCQKPLSHDAWEAKRMAEVAAEEKVITMIGSPMICDSRAEGYRAQREAVLAEAAGGVVESHVGVDHTPCVLGASRPAGSDPVLPLSIRPPAPYHIDPRKGVRNPCGNQNPLQAVVDCREQRQFGPSRSCRNVSP